MRYFLKGCVSVKFARRWPHYKVIGAQTDVQRISIIKAELSSVQFSSLQAFDE